MYGAMQLEAHSQQLKSRRKLNPGDGGLAEVSAKAGGSEGPPTP